MEFQEVVRRRRMVRRFTGDPVNDESLHRILSNAVRGPSAGFSQGQAFLVLRDAALDRLWTLGQIWTLDSVRTAPVVIIPFAVKNDYLDRYAKPDKGWVDRDEGRWPVPFWYIDTGMAVLLILQTAVDAGLGAVYFGLDPEAVEQLRTAFGVPADHDPIGAVAVGHPDEAAPDASSSAQTIPRRPLSAMVHFDRW